MQPAHVQSQHFFFYLIRKFFSENPTRFSLKKNPTNSPKYKTNITIQFQIESIY